MLGHHDVMPGPYYSHFIFKLNMIWHDIAQFLRSYLPHNCIQIFQLLNTAHNHTHTHTQTLSIYICLISNLFSNWVFHKNCSQLANNVCLIRVLSASIFHCCCINKGTTNFIRIIFKLSNLNKELRFITLLSKRCVLMPSTMMYAGYSTRSVK
jgi:hypothetical protein